MHKHKYTNTNTNAQTQVHKHTYTNTSIQTQINKFTLGAEAVSAERIMNINEEPHVDFSVKIYHTFWHIFIQGPFPPNNIF